MFEFINEVQFSAKKISSFRMCRVVVLFAQKPFKLIQRGLREDHVLYYLRVVFKF